MSDLQSLPYSLEVDCCSCFLILSSVGQLRTFASFWPFWRTRTPTTPDRRRCPELAHLRLQGSRASNRHFTSTMDPGLLIDAGEPFELLPSFKEAVDQATSTDEATSSNMLSQDGYDLFEEHMQPIIQGGCAFEIGPTGARIKIRGLWSRMSAEQRAFWAERTARVRRHEVQALDAGILRTYLEAEATALIDQFSELGEEWREVKLVRLQAYGFYGFKEMPIQAEAYEDLLVRFDATGDAVVVCREEATATPQSLITASGENLFDYHGVRAGGVHASSRDKAVRRWAKMAAWTGTPVVEKNFWIWQAVQLLQALLKRSAGSLVFLRTDIMLERLALYRRIIAKHHSMLPAFGVPQATDAVEKVPNTTLLEPQDHRPVKPFVRREQKATVATGPKSAEMQKEPSPEPGDQSATPILDLLFDGNAALAYTDKLVQEVCRGIARRMQRYKGMSLEGRHCGMRINFYPRYKGATGIRQRLLVNSTRPELPENDKMDSLSREQFCEWLLKPLVAWNRKAFPELKDVEITTTEDKFGGSGRYRSTCESLKLRIPKNLFASGQEGEIAKQDAIVKFILQHLRGLVSKKVSSILTLTSSDGLLISIEPELRTFPAQEHARCKISARIHAVEMGTG